MRVSTSQFHQRGINAILDQQSNVARTQLQISTGKRVLTPSDDPVGATRIVAFNQEIARFEQLNDNTNFAESRLELEEATLASSIDLIQRVRELIITGNTATLGLSERKGIIHEIELRLNELVGLGNTRDAGGEYMFAGFKGSTQPFTRDPTGKLIYAGDEGQRFIQIGTSTQVSISDSGQSVFQSIKAGNGSFVVKDNPANTGTGVIDNGSVVDFVAYTPDTYTITFTTNSAGERAFNVQNSSGTYLIPASVPPDDPNNDAQTYVEDAVITFGGIKTSISGTPEVGDTFTIEPSKNHSIFETFEDAIVGLAKTDTERLNAMSRVLINLDQALNNITDTRSVIGARLNAIEAEREVNDSVILSTKKNLSTIEDLDIAQAVSELTQRSLALTAAQQSFVRIQGLTIFNFIR